MKQTKEPASEAKAQGLGHFRFVMQGSIVEFEFFKRITQGVVLTGFSGVQTGKHLRLDFLEARQRFGCRTQVVGQLLFQRDGVADLGRLDRKSVV